MKKIALLLVSILIVGGMTANAQGLVVKAGFNYTNANSVQDLKGGKSGWLVGVGVQSESWTGFSIQPELIYKVKGVTLEDATKLSMNYVEVPVNIQWGPDLLIARPFVFASPFIGYNLKNRFSKETTLAETINKNFHRFEYGLGLGLGLNVWKLQIAGKYNWNFGRITTWGDAVDNVKGLDPAAKTFEISVGLKF
ncbi:MAG: PorT family protein [Bacteroidales bacterium]|nr:PorT family protein [Bacteroidales bacterium]MBR0500165.1 PorT family protein [Bacteroidales bacterium]